VASGESSEENFNEFSDEENNKALEACKSPQKIRGYYVLVAFPTEKNDKKNYMCVVQDLFEGNEEAEVVGMVCCNKEKTTFKLKEDDVSIIKLSQIIKKMDFLKMEIAGERLRYEFSETVDVYEYPVYQVPTEVPT
jgi:hypothetical protein